MISRNSILPWLWYPFFIGIALSLHFYLKAVGFSLIVSTYLPVTLAALGIILLELQFPYRQQWKPDAKDILNDGTFLALVQVVLPQLLTLFVALALVTVIDFGAGFWPRELPDLIQVVLMILIADFFRYWFHIASHQWFPLWQLHAVHHSPHKLYWLNVARFHPVEKAIQFLFDAMPFILLGVDQSVLSLYFVFYAVNGYFQHCNINLKFGWLNYLISTAELHRWHHSAISDEANRNYGNNIIIWDLLFGTYYLPKTTEVDLLGLCNRHYKQSFINQMKAPFIPNMENTELPMLGYKDIMINLVLGLRFFLLRRLNWPDLIKASQQPQETQTNVLLAIINANSESRFGQDHNFSSIGSYGEFVANCPIQSYDSLSSYIDTQNRNDMGLTSETPVFYQVTSGTTGAAKYLPMTKTGLASNKALQNRVALARYLHNSNAYTGKIFGIASPAIEGRVESGLNFGSASGLAYQDMPAITRAKYVVPYEVFEIEDYDIKYFLIALFVISEPLVTLAATANPSTMLRLIELINQHQAQLLKLLETGENINDDISDPAAAEIIAEFKPNPTLARNLRSIMTARGVLTYQDLWPHLQQLVTWTGGSCGMALSSLKKYLAPDTEIIEIGYLASEVRATITLDDGIGLPTLTDNFFEFVERDDWEDDQVEIRLLQDLEIEKQYYVIVTTINGLYRYFMNDIIEVTGMYNSTPTIRFLQKGKGATNITGEKLYESQSLEAIKILEESLDVTVRFHQWLADEANATYILYLEIGTADLLNVEQCQEALDRALGELNIEYKQKRASGRLKPPIARLLKSGTGETFKKFHLANGQREGQFKALSLSYLKDCSFPFDDHMIAVT